MNDLLREAKELRGANPDEELVDDQFGCRLCDETFKTELAKERHFIKDHPPRRERIDNYPRSPSER